MSVSSNGRTRISHRNVRVDVRQTYIETAMKSESGHCMIADAIRDQVKGIKSISVDLATIRFTDKKEKCRYVYLTPIIAQQALVDFDQGKDLKPFSFILRTAMQTAVSEHRGESLRKKIVLPIGEPERSSIPVVIGGKLPPRGALSNSIRTGRIRRYGVKGLKP